jgi:hypothetical protein
MSPDGPRNPKGIPNGRGGRENNDPGSEKADDKTKPLPPVSQKSPDGSDPSVAPDVPKPDLVLRKLQDLLKDDKFTPDVEKKLGMSRDEAEQFVKKFEKREQPGPTGEGRTIEAKPEKEKVFDKDRKAPEFKTSATVSNSNTRTGTSIPQDNISGLSEGGKSAPPPEIRRQYEAFKRSLAKSKVVAPSTSTPPAKK